MDKVRKIILAVRDAEGPLNGKSIEGVTEAEFAMHAQLLDEAGLIQAALQGEGKRVAQSAVIFRLTWQGHDFADSIVDETLWNKAKEHVINPTASWTFSILKEYLKAEIRSRIPGLEAGQ
ncbi:DUF2513 domain-containing protein [Neptunomonas concharum]|nr:DUF2513 domain-containing protein [Neptunomonas concharum]